MVPQAGRRRRWKLEWSVWRKQLRVRIHNAPVEAYDGLWRWQCLPSWWDGRFPDNAWNGSQGWWRGSSTRACAIQYDNKDILKLKCSWVSDEWDCRAGGHALRAFLRAEWAICCNGRRLHYSYWSSRFWDDFDLRSFIKEVVSTNYIWEHSKSTSRILYSGC